MDLSIFDEWDLSQLVGVDGRTLLEREVRRIIPKEQLKQLVEKAEDEHYLSRLDNGPTRTIATGDVVVRLDHESGTRYRIEGFPDSTTMEIRNLQTGKMRTVKRRKFPIVPAT